MQAYKLKGTIDPSGRLIIHEPIAIPPGEVEVIMWASESEEKPDTHLLSERPTTEATPKRPTKIKALEDWFAHTEPAPPDFDPEQARWEALKEKYDL